MIDIWAYRFEREAERERERDRGGQERKKPREKNALHLNNNLVQNFSVIKQVIKVVSVNNSTFIWPVILYNGRKWLNILCK